jgi:endonuclease/exonuclease/phosphatase (EEP) superfamily protein YafD
MNHAPWRGHVEVAALLLGCVLGMATVLGYLGSWSWVLDLFSPFRIQYVVLASLLAIVASALKRMLLAFVSVVIAIANLPPIVPQFVRTAVAATVERGPALKVLSFNVFKYSSQYQRMVDMVRSEAPDVLILIEVTPQWEPALAMLAPDYAYRWVNVGDDIRGLAVLTRRVPHESHVIDLGGNGVPSLLFTLPSPGGDITFVATHLSWPLGSRRAAIRNAQLATLARLAHEQRGAFAIVGDLNVTPYSPRFQQLLRDGELRNCAQGMGPQATWPALLVPLYIQIDHCLATAAVTASHFRVGGFLGSDHYPITVELRVQVPGRAPPLADMPPVSTRRIASSTPMSSGVSRARGR